jgi:hypothetical protein
MDAIFQFIDSHSAPLTIPDSNGAPAISPNYPPWHRQGQLLLGWIRSSLTEDIQAQVVSCTTTSDLWSSALPSLLVPDTLNYADSFRPSPRASSHAQSTYRELT